MCVFSLDLDGTCNIDIHGGPIELEHIWELINQGHHVVGASGWNEDYQRSLWEQAGIPVKGVDSKRGNPEFVQMCHSLAAQHEGGVWIHVGDLYSDKQVAHLLYKAVWWAPWEFLRWLRTQPPGCPRLDEFNWIQAQPGANGWWDHW